jgi:hypothetical protein
MDEHEPFGMDRAGGLAGQRVVFEAAEPWNDAPKANTPPSPVPSQ